MRKDSSADEPDPPTEPIEPIDREPDTLVTPAKGTPQVAEVERKLRTATPPAATRTAPSVRTPTRGAKTVPPPIPPMRSGSVITDDPTTMHSTYAFGDIIGRGGMGEVLLAHDRKIGRDVAVKRLRTASPSEDEAARFLREARIQARLDHPAIVPVYEVSKDELGRPYFAMKRVAGRTLSEILKVATQLRMLRAFADVCRAIDFAHAKGIVHRDLKPSNIVLGEFGEVYVIDWGVARVLGDAADLVTADIDTLEGSAPAGQTLGTPGYMSPEQIDTPDVGRSADIYALGSILFEILAGDPFHPRDNALESTIASTLSTSPAGRRPERGIPPELDALCSVMLAKKASLRPTARWCAETIEKYLDGDRDLANRRQMAIDMVAQARGALDANRRPDAMRMAGRAISLDPNAEGAAELVTHLMLDPPREPPAELRRALQQSDASYIATHAKAAIPGYVLIALFLPLVVFSGVNDWSVVAAVVAAALGMAAAAWFLMRQPDRSFVWMVAYAAGNSLVLVLLARLGGPFTFVPALVSYITASVITYPSFLERSWVLIGVMVAGFLIPFGLEASGVIARTWELRDGGMFLRGSAMNLGTNASLAVVIGGSVAVVVMAGIQCAVLGRANRKAQHQLVSIAWHLQQMLPASASLRMPAMPASGPRSV
jgi:eukaryotic-like serine/threonine-protein kinase